MTEHTRLRDYSSERPFRVWDFRVSHSLLLVRSPRSPSGPLEENVDLIFTGVDYLALPTQLTGIRVTVASPSALADLVPKLTRPMSQGRRLYVIESEGKRHHVVAAQLAVARTTCESMESSLILHFSPQEGAEEAFLRQYVREYALVDGGS